MSIPVPDPQAYGWIRTVLDESLKSVIDAVSDVADSQKIGSLNGIDRDLHQIKGSLQIVELDAASILAGECEELVSILQCTDVHSQIVQQIKILKPGIELLIDYLDLIGEQKSRSPLVLVQQINNIRTELGKNKITPFSLFNPSLVWQQNDSMINSEFAEAPTYMVGDLKKEFRKSLLYWLVGNNEQEALKVMANIMNHLYAVSEIDVLKELWWVAYGFIDAILNGDIVASSDVKSQFARIDIEIGRMKDQDRASILRSPPDDLLRKMLFYIGNVTSERSKLVGQIKTEAGLYEWFNLDMFSPEDDEFSKLKQQIKQYAKLITVDEFNAIESKIDSYFGQIQTDQILIEEIKSSCVQLIEKADGFNLGVLFDLLIAVKHVLYKLADQPDLKNNHNTQIDLILASAFLSFQDSLFTDTALTPSWQQDTENCIKELSQISDSIQSQPAPQRRSETPDYTNAVIALRLILEQYLAKIKQHFKQYTQGVNNPELFAKLSNHFTGICALLTMLEWHHTALFTKAIFGRLQEYNSKNIIPGGEETEAFAFAITALGVNIERLDWGQNEDMALIEAALDKIKKIRISGRRSSQENTQSMLQVEPLSNEVEQGQQTIINPVSLSNQEEKELRDIYVDEMKQHMVRLRSHLLDAPQDMSENMAEIHRILHTMTGNCLNMGYSVLADIADTLLKFIDKPGQVSRLITDGREQILVPLMSTIDQSVKDISATGQIEASQVSSLLGLQKYITHFDSDKLGTDSEIHDIAPTQDVAETTDPDESLNDIFIAECKEILGRVKLVLAQIFQTEVNDDHLQQLRREFHTLKGSSYAVGYQDMGNLCYGIETLLTTKLNKNEVSQLVPFNLLEEAHDVLASTVGLIPVTADDALPAMQKMIDALLIDGSDESARVDESVAPIEHAEFVEPLPQPETADLEHTAKQDEQKNQAESIPQTNLSITDESSENELVLLFREEGEEILGRIESTLKAWHGSDQNEEYLYAVQRELHTLKGSAAACSFDDISDLLHSLESLLSKPILNQKELLDVIEQSLDGVAAELGLLPKLDVYKLKYLKEQVQGLVKRSEQLSQKLPSVDLDVDKTHSPKRDIVDHIQQEKKPIKKDNKQIKNDSKQALELVSSVAKITKDVNDDKLQKQSIKNESGSSIRIEANRLSELLNTSGEMGIVRSRLYTTLDSTKYLLELMHKGMHDLRGDLQQIELEAEAQIRSKPELIEEQVGEDEFDPLQLDRYSALQGKTRDVAEKLEKLTHIKRLLDGNTSNFGGTLLQNDQLGQQIQTSLMSVRMVSISTYKPRLRHLVREISHHAEKQVNFVMHGGDIKIDRVVVDTMMAPFEHMIRNTISHSIETAKVRKECGKSKFGLVRLAVSQQGAELVLEYSDDGQGIDTELIRKHAQQVGLAVGEEEISDEQLLKIIVHPGFTTTQSVSMESGRGIGMDVVIRAVQQLGGLIELKNNPGKGVKFLFRLPVSLAVSKVLLVKVGGIKFAVHARIIVRVLRIDKKEIKINGQQQQELIVDQRRYPVVHLAQKMGLTPSSEPSNMVSILLIRLADQVVAMEVDSFTDTVDMVSKQPGTQLISIVGVSGGTVLPDSSIALILDPVAFIDRTIAPESVASGENDSQQQLRILAVDDSITVRKIMQKDLKSLSMDVAIAVDGIDALDKLAKQTFDVLLIDIEMPRMNGYQLLTQIREHPKYCGLPVIIVTSRSGEKHKEKAISLGANAYLTKPYTIDKIEHLIYQVVQNKELVH